MKFNITLKITVVFLLLFIVSTLYSQEKFVQGFVIQQNGDTIKGLIDYRNWSRNPKIVTFKNTKGETQRFTPLDIKAFGALDEIYKSAIVNVDSTNLKDISKTPVFEFRTDTVFLQTLFQGSKSLYYYKDGFDQENFYIFSEKGFELLEYKTYMKLNETAHMFLMHNKRYIGQLRFYLNDCPGIDSKLKDIEYTLKKMQVLFKFYYSQKKQESYFNRTNEQFKTEVGIVGGASMIDLRFVTSSIAFDPLPKAKFANTFSPTVGLFVNFVIPRNDGRWSLYNELVYSKYNTSAVYTVFHSLDNYQIHNYKVDISYGKINTMVRYKYPLGKLNAFADAGFSIGLIVDEMNSDSINRQYNGTNTWEIENIITDVSINDPFVSKKYELGALLGLGINYQHFFAEVRFEAGTGFTPFPALEINANRLHFLLGYKF